MSILEALRADIAKLGLTPEAEDWADLQKSAKVGRKANREQILDSAGVTDTWVFVASGFAASYYSHRDGRQTLTRFFEPGHIAGNVSSTWSQDYGSDELIAISGVDYVELPHSYLLGQYMRGDAIGDYVRMKVIETLRYDKDLLVCQALNDPEARYRFLHRRHPELMSVALKKDVAAFMGVTPQGYSRFLRRRAAT
ncbi:Crp/Fnr family transcriptional regulator [Tateyamaria sp. SN3-11]|uniref:Crp/Fnr family transcriptional regulator n=1 Tax=Tateyamaria sp. SN3-11 TaxID=3092147 RepID=UPI0039EA270A